MQPQLKIAIAGCGIAGLASALLLSRQGHIVHLFDRFDTPQPVGSGLMLQPTGMAVLDRIGIAGDALARGAKIDGLLGLNEQGRIALRAFYADLGERDVYGVGIHRSSLFNLLYDAVKRAKIEISTGFDIEGLRRNSGTSRLVTEDGDESASFDLIVDATGLHSPLVKTGFAYLQFGALWANVEWPSAGNFNPRLLEQRYRSARQMVGMLPIGRREAAAPKEAAFFWSLPGTEYQKWRKAPLGDWKAEAVALWPEIEGVLGQINSHDQLTFARYAHRTTPCPAGDGIIHIGDAWHSASPQLGQGANMALLDAWALSRGLAEGRTVQEGLRLTTAWRKEHVQIYQVITALFTPLFQSKSNLPAAVRDHFTAPLSRYWPTKKIQSLLVGGLFGAPLQQLGLEIPDYSELSNAAKIISRASAEDQS